MKKFSNICCGDSDTDEEEDPPSSVPQPLNHPSESSSSSQLPSHLLGLPNFRIMCALEHDDAFSVKEARFTPDGNKHRIVIKFNKTDKTTMTLTIDGKRYYTVNTKWNIRGHTWLVIDDFNVWFTWDVHGTVKKFTFRIRINTGGGEDDGESSVGGEGSVCGDSWDPEFRGGHWEDRDQFHWLQIIGA